MAWYITELKRITAILERTHSDLNDSERLDVIECARRLNWIGRRQSEPRPNDDTMMGI